MVAAEDIDQECWTPQLVDLWLRRYRTLVAVVATGTVQAVQFHDEAGGGSVDQHRLIDIKADLDRALTQLTQLDEDPVAAAYIWECYVKGRSTDQVADAESVAQRTVQWRISKGRYRMATILGWYPR